MRSEMPYSPRLAKLAPNVLVLDAVGADREVGVVDRAYDVGAGDVEDLVAALEALEVVQGQVVLLEHGAHRAVGDDDALGERAAQGGWLCGHRDLLGYVQGRDVTDYHVRRSVSDSCLDGGVIGSVRSPWNCASSARAGIRFAYAVRWKVINIEADLGSRTRS